MLIMGSCYVELGCAGFVRQYIKTNLQKQQKIKKSPSFWKREKTKMRQRKVKSEKKS